MKKFILLFVLAPSLFLGKLFSDYGNNASDFSQSRMVCDEGYTEINELCFYNDDIEVLQAFIDNSYASGIDLGCEDWNAYCGSPNPQMDSPTDSWFWNIVDSTSYFFANGNGIVDPLVLGLQEWQNGRLKSIMCGAYIYCQLSGEIPETIDNLTEISQLRLEYNYLSGTIPDEVCDLGVDYTNSLDFDFDGNHLCPPYPACIDTSGFWSQDTDNCYNLGDINFDGLINVIDVVEIVNLILNVEFDPIADMNNDLIVNIQDIVLIVDIILNNND